MSNNANVTIDAIRKLVAGKNLPTSLSPQELKDLTGLSDDDLKEAVAEIADTKGYIVAEFGSNQLINISVSLGFV